MVEIQIHKGSSECLRCRQPFVHNQKHYSLLRIEGVDFFREDYCEACWKEAAYPPESDEVYSHWETKYRDPAVERATPKEQFLPLLNICYESIAVGGPDAEGMVYVCALILRRQKVFRFIREERDESLSRDVLVFLDKHHDTQLRIVDPHLTDSRLREIREKLEAHLGYAKEDSDER